MRIASRCCSRNYLLVLLVSDAIRCSFAAILGEIPKFGGDGIGCPS
jgi:hypothetical protein